MALGEKLNIPVCATCDSHFVNREDEIFRKILLKGMKFSDGDRDVGLYLRTTAEMLEEFAYLGEEKAYEVVVTNTRAIAAQIEKLKPIPDGSFTPKMDGAEEDLQRLCWERAADWYGFEGKIPEIVSAFRVLDMGEPIAFYDAIITGGRRKGEGEYGTIGEMAVKPHPWIYSELVGGLNVDKKHAIVIEDSSAGLLSGRLAGMNVIGFNDGNLIQSGLHEECIAMVDTFEDVIKFLQIKKQ